MIFDSVDIDIEEVKDLKAYIGQRFVFDAVVQSVTLKKSRDGASFIQLDITRNGGFWQVFDWDGSKDTLPYWEVGKVYTFYVEVQSFRTSLKLCHSELTNRNSSELMKWEDGYEEALEGIKQYIAEIQHTEIGRLTIRLLQKNWEKFRDIPAGKSNHHRWLGGLVVHSYCVAKGCKEMGEFYNHLRPSNDYDFLNLNLLLCGALLHDIGKLKEFEYDNHLAHVEYSLDSQLMTHLGIGMLMIHEEAIAMGIADTQEVRELEHLIASHHGKTEYQAIIEPHMLEAKILASMDMLDAQINRQGEINKKIEHGSGRSDWEGGKATAYYNSIPEKKEIKI